MIEVPIEFSPHINTTYPQENFVIFEEWFAQQNIPETEREYLPIFWTSYFVNHNYGQDKGALKRLQQFVNTLDVHKKYYLINQYDDSILVDVSHLDLLQFNMSKNLPNGYPLPLLCQPSQYADASKKKTIFASFIGNRTHPIRDKILSISNSDYYVSDVNKSPEAYFDILSSSIFSLCPRGYGFSSFRISESIQCGAIPIYISDTFIIPHNVDFNEYGILVHESELDKLPEILNNISPLEIIDKQDKLKRIYADLYTYKGSFDRIIKHLQGDS